MIAKASRRVAGGSIEKLAAYIGNEKRIGDLRDWSRTADYILDTKGGGARVAAMRVMNCANEELPLALAEIKATQDANTTSRTDKTYHLIVSFPPGERPPLAQVHDIEDTLCAAIGLVDHQRISAVHNDTDHFHFHVAINKVHPQTGRAITPYFDQPRLAAACLELERRHGLTPTNHEMPDRSARHRDRAAAMELHGGQQSLNQWVQDEAGPALLAAAESGQGWQDIHRAAARFGLEVKLRGAGLIIAVAGDKRARVKPSDIDHRLTFRALTDKWGAYEPPIGAQAAPERAYPRAPVQDYAPQTAELFRQYQRDRERVLEQRQAAREQARADAKVFREELAAWSEERRQAIKQMPHTADGRRYAYADLKRARQRALDTERDRRAEERKVIPAHPLPTWQEWLQAQAGTGDALAAEVLRSAAQKRVALGEAILTAEDASQARHVVYQHLRPTVRRDGSIVYRVADGGRVTDQANQVRVDEISVAASFLALSLAADRFGDTALAVDGTAEFKHQVAQLAAVEGMNVSFADATMEEERRGQAAALKARQAARPSGVPAAPEAEADPPVPAALAAFLADRNAMRQRVPDILPHRLWRSGDAGDAVYGGRRHLAGDLEAVLLHRDGETLVKPVTPAQAAKSAGWRIGDTIRTDARGRFHDHRPGPQQDRRGPER